LGRAEVAARRASIYTVGSMQNKRSSLVRATASDVQLWVPVAVLILGIALLAVIR